MPVIAGFREMWQPVYLKYKPFFDCALKMAPIVSQMIQTPVQGRLFQVVGRMAAAASNTYGATLALVLNGYGHDAVRLARSLFEIELNVLRLKLHPEEIDDFLDYHFIRQKQLFDLFNDEQKKNFTEEQYGRMMAEYEAVLPRFATFRDKTRPRNEWCRASLYEKAKEAGEGHLELYQIFYRQASSMHHLDFSGIVAHSDADMQADMAPSWACLEDALVGTGSALRAIALYDEIAGLGFAARIQDGPLSDYVQACKRLRRP